MAPDENIREAETTSFYMKKIKIYATVNTNFRALDAQGQCIKEEASLLPSSPDKEFAFNVQGWTEIDAGILYCCQCSPVASHAVGAESGN